MAEKFDSQEKSRILPVSPEYQQLKDQIAKLYTEANKDQLREIMGEISAKVKSLREKYPEGHRYEILHAVSGSSLSRDNGPDFYIKGDFPGEDSLALVVSYLTKKYGI